MATTAVSVKPSTSFIQSTANYFAPSKERAPSLSLNRYVQVQPTALANLHARQEKIWNTAAIASLVVYVIFATASFVAANLLAPTWVPLVLALIFTLSPIIYINCYSTMKAKADSHAAKALVEKGVAKHLALLPTTPEKIIAILTGLGIDIKTIKNQDKLKTLTDLRPVVARFQHWNETSKKWLTTYQEEKSKLLRVNVQTAKEGQKIQTARKEALSHLENSQVAKVRAALQLKILQDPCFRGDENDNDLFSFEFPSTEERLVRKNFLDPSWDVIAIRKDSKKSLIGFDALSKTNVRDVFPIKG